MTLLPIRYTRGERKMHFVAVALSESEEARGFGLKFDDLMQTLEKKRILFALGLRVVIKRIKVKEGIFFV